MRWIYIAFFSSFISTMAVAGNGAKTVALLDLNAPSKLVLGQDSKARITFRKPEGATPNIIASIGEISGVTENGANRVAFDYIPPDQLFPQVAIIAVLSEDHRLLDWTSIQLHAPAQIESKTEPRASVSIRIGDTEFGPVVANKRGRATVDVIVPPGIVQGWTISKDLAGNASKTPLPLNTPQFNRVLAVCPHMGDQLVAIAVDATGNPEENAPLEVGADKGRLSKPKHTAKGVYRSAFTVSNDAKLGEITAFRTWLSKTTSESTCRVKIRGGLVNQVQLEVTPSQFIAGKTKEVAIQVHFKDKQGGPAQPVPVEIAPNFGTISPLRPGVGNAFIATWRVPTSFADRQQAEVTLQTAQAPKIKTRAELMLKPGHLARIVVNTAQDKLNADGRSQTTLYAQGFDAFDNPVRNLKLQASAGGEMTDLSDADGDGQFQGTYTAPKRRRSTRDTILVSDDQRGIEGRTKVTLVSKRPPSAVGARLGYISNFGKISTAAYMADVTYHPPILERNLSFGVETGFYWEKIEQPSKNDDQELVKTSLWSLPLLVRTTYQLSFHPFGFYFGIGGGTVISSNREASQTAGSTDARKAGGALSGIVGADFIWGIGRVVLEIAYIRTFLRDMAVDGNLGGLFITAGYRFELFVGL
ncbi:MAG: hypothetical protein QNJ97_23690 [Myxococcota bacterium]|nr:hypothetical protein [Myxococcota bacterium]